MLFSVKGTWCLYSFYSIFLCVRFLRTLDKISSLPANLMWLFCIKCASLSTPLPKIRLSSSRLLYMCILTPSSKSWLCFSGVSSALYFASCWKPWGKNLVSISSPHYSVQDEIFKPVKICMIGLTDSLFQWCCLLVAKQLLSEKTNAQEVDVIPIVRYSSWVS